MKSKWSKKSLSGQLSQYSSVDMCIATQQFTIGYFTQIFKQFVWCVWCFWHYYYSHLNRRIQHNRHPLAPMPVKETSSEYQSCARIGKEMEHRVAGMTGSQWRGNKVAKGDAKPFINWSWERGHRGMEDGTTARGTRANIPPNVETLVSARHLYTVVQLIL